jgi:hypothetical protein
MPNGRAIEGRFSKEENMPYRVSKVKGGYSVRSPHGVKAKRTTRPKAEAQVRLLRAIKHGFKPTGRPKAKPSHKGPLPDKRLRHNPGQYERAKATPKGGLKGWAPGDLRGY